MTEYAEVFEKFGLAAAESIYPYAPVFRGLVAGRDAVVKRTHSAEAMGRWVRHLDATGFPVVTPLAGPHRIGEHDWVAYPWIEGRLYDGSAADLADAGRLLGRMHADLDSDAGLARFDWPDHDAASVEEDVTGLDRTLAAHLPQARGELMGRFTPLIEGFMTTTLPAVRDAELPAADVSVDFKAVNLVYTADGPVLVDPDNGERIPRLLDLALAVLFFHNDLPAGPGRLFDDVEWRLFRDAYLGCVQLTGTERELWPTALLYMVLEWGVWAVINGGEAGDWELPRQRALFTDLLTFDVNRFPLTS
ncbi:phosphotransferase [Nonomuraea sp. LPB2021202275-12-8]|uniref:phosphotransferase n=1 Tax=Nonomuraea sp. LPB2021202275-12-8 TaxID=3120159 RepID=UPI00300CF70B